MTERRIQKLGGLSHRTCCTHGQIHILSHNYQLLKHYKQMHISQAGYLLRIITVKFPAHSVYLISIIISSIHHQECIVPNADIRIWGTLIASFREMLLHFRSCWIVFIHTVWGRPGGLL